MTFVAIARRVATHLVIGLTLAGSGAWAQQPAKLPRIGILWPGDVDPYNKAFVEGLRQQGYVDGVTASIQIRSTGPNIESGIKLAEELVAQDPEVIFVVPAGLARYVLRAIEQSRKKIPVVVLSFDPLAEGLVTSAAHPGGNVTGVGGAHDPELMTKLLQVLKEVAPKVSRVVYLEDPAWGANERYRLRARSALAAGGRKLGVSVTSVEVRTAEDLDRAFSEAARQRADAMISTASAFVLTHRGRLINLAAKYRLPTIYGDELFTQDGGLMSYWTSIADMHIRAAGLVGKILRGAKPGDLPIEYPARFRLVINERTAKNLNLAIPNSIMMQADEVLR